MSHVGSMRLVIYAVPAGAYFAVGGVVPVPVEPASVLLVLVPVPAVVPF